MHLARRSPPPSSQIRELLSLTQRPGMLSLAGGMPAAEALPVERIGAAVDGLLHRCGAMGSTALQYGPTDGLDELREIVAASAGARAADVLVTTGSQQGLDLLARALVDPGDVVAMGEPGYLGAAQTFIAHGARLVGLPVDRAGLDTDALAARLREGLRPKAVYVVPNFDNPTGATLSAPRRHDLVALAERYGFVVVEDDPYGALRFDGAAPAPLAAPGAPVARLSSASKTIAPGLRVGWLTAPPDLRDRCSQIKQAVDLHTATLNQLIVAELIADAGWYEAHLTRVRELYRGRAVALRETLVTSPHLCVGPAEGGMFVWVRMVDTPCRATQLLPLAVERGVAFVPGPAFSLDGTSFDDALRLCFASLPAAQLEQAAGRLLAGLELGRLLPDRLGALVPGAHCPDRR